MLGKAKRGFWYLVGGMFPTWYSGYLYQKAFGRKLNLDDPSGLNEKIMWLKLNTYRNNPLVTQCSDKYAVRQYVRDMGCGEILNELHGVWNRSGEIDWEQLPEQFVLKCNHGSGYNRICRSKKELDIPACRRQLDKWMRRDFWRFSAEVQYKGIPKRIICEKMLDSPEGLTDYKFYCFHGEPYCVLVCYERERGWPHFNFFDEDWNFLPISWEGKLESPDFTLPKPPQLKEMFDYARKLSAPFPFVRVDLYDVDGRVVFGELTFTPAAALDTARPADTDRMFGAMLNIRQ